MTNILRIPANSQAYLTVIRDSAVDKFDIVDYKYGYLNPIPFPTPWAYWKLEETIGNPRLDSTGNNRTLTEVNQDVDSGVGKIGTAAYFPDTDGTQQNLNTNDLAPDLTGNKKFTVSFWIKFHRIATSTFEIDFYCNFAAGDGVYLTLGLKNLQTNAYIYAGTTSRFLQCTNIITPDVYHFVTLYYNQVGLYLEIDNVAIVSSLGVSGVTYAPGKVSFGGISPNNKMSILLDEVGYWVGDNALTADQRSYLWNNGVGRSLY